MPRALLTIVVILVPLMHSIAVEPLHLRGDSPSGGAPPGAAGKPEYVAKPPLPYLYDTLVGRSFDNRGCMEFKPSDSLAIPLNGWPAGTSFTLEALARADKLQDALKPGGIAPVARLHSDKLAAELHVHQSYPPHSYPWWQGSFTTSAGREERLARNVFKGLTHVNDQDWRHLGLVYDAPTRRVRFYVDYTLLEERIAPEALEFRKAMLTVGGKRGESGFAGLIDEVRLTPSALAPHQFLRALQQPLVGVNYESAAKWLPRDSGYVDVRLRYGAVGDGKTDDTAAFNKAFKELASRVPLEFNTLFIPNGTYLLSDTIQWSRFLTVQGESRDGVVLKLKDKAPGFADPAKPRPLVVASNWGGGVGSGSAIASYLFDVTIDTGSGNPGAIGLDYHSNNIGVVENVSIRSGDGAGKAGISMLRPWPGPSLIRDVNIRGFDFGVHITHREYSMTFEGLTLEGQRIAGIRNTSNILAIRKLHSRNRVPAVVSDGVEAMVTLLDSDLLGGSPDHFAIELGSPGSLFARNVRSEGYRGVLKDQDKVLAEASLEEYVSAAPQGLFGKATKSLNLPIKETPRLDWPSADQWVSVQRFADRRGPDGDWAPALQAAIDSGATHLYLPPDRYWVKSTVSLRGKVRCMFGMMTGINPHESLKGQPVLRFDSPGADTVWIERLDVHGLEHASPGTLVVRHGSMTPYRNTRGCGPLFVENQVGGTGYEFLHPQHVWFRQWNVESHDTGPCVICKGTTLWSLGFKTEYESIKLDAQDGARVEILGSFIYPIGKIPEDRPIFQSKDSLLSLVYGTSIYRSGHKVHVRAIRGDATRELTGSEVKFYGSRQKMHLYVDGP